MTVYLFTPCLPNFLDLQSFSNALRTCLGVKSNDIQKANQGQQYKNIKNRKNIKKDAYESAWPNVPDLAKSFILESGLNALTNRRILKKLALIYLNFFTKLNIEKL